MANVTGKQLIALLRKDGWHEGDAIRGLQIVIEAERIDVDRQRRKLTHEHSVVHGIAKGEAFTYIDMPLRSRPKAVRG